MKSHKDLKIELKALVLQIRETRKDVREAQKNPIGAMKAWWELLGKLSRAQHEYRHKHIVYCLLRGRTRDQIETPKYSKPDERYIETLQQQYCHERDLTAHLQVENASLLKELAEAKQKYGELQGSLKASMQSVVDSNTPTGTKVKGILGRFLS